MRSVFKVALALALLTAASSAYAQTRCYPVPKTIKKWQLHDGCHSAYAKMKGRPCH
ncbi:hypothetical protein SSBR45G_61540 [Bradyrhizobium sp. SSBR45G]|uniref:hypothetical protein n=1 Tax=unclassified Bradyrhizobium TaxID=2631580 RepID=UPI002342B91B|nr:MULTISPECIES: hypothetical protein [unclassified Bradyrhizobium]GLH81245.1 hypothetical protein SSBR45G_61540 [Bradyrhizobium sp. SSBR45G]GLH88735.1 hypothetical protein SSBR45R_61960 [Bradyrhizobium sp. SSBR45R]